MIKRIARRQGGPSARTDAPGSSSSRSTASALPILRSAMRDGSAPNLARWIAEDGYRLTEWETDLSSQTGASQAGHPARLERGHPRLPLGREGDAGRLMSCSAPGRLRRDRAPPLDRDRPARQRWRQPRQPALRRGRRGDPHGQPDRGREAGKPRLPRLPRQRLQRHPGAGPVRLGGRAGVDRGDPRDPPRRAPARPPRRHLSVPARRDVRGRPRPDRLRGAHRHDAAAGPASTRPSRATTRSLTTRACSAPTRWRRCASSTSSSGASTQARRYAPRPYEIVVLSDHGQTQGATFKQRNGYGLDELVERSLASGEVAELAGGDEQAAMVGHALGEATGREREQARARTTSPTARSSSSARGTSA